MRPPSGVRATNLPAKAWNSADTARGIRRLRELLDEMAVHTTLKFLYYSWEVRSVPEAGSISPDGKLDSPRARAAMAEYCSFNRFKSSSLKSSRLMNAF